MESGQDLSTELMLTPEVAAITRVPAATLRYFRHAGIGPASFKLGRRVVYRRSAVMAWLDAHEHAESGPDAA